jgi:hypothetical protein
VTPPPGSRTEAGFTLLELAIATIVLLLAVLLAADLLSESGRLLHHSVRRARDPYTLLGAELLRNDLRGALPPASDFGLWTSEPLPLQTPTGLVVWMRGDEGELLRVRGDGTAFTYLREVRSFRWRSLAGNGVEVWVQFHVSSPYLRQLAGSLPKSDPGEQQDLHLLLVARGGGVFAW